VLVEPLGADVPPRHWLTEPTSLRTAAAAAAAVLALTSSGDALVLALALGLAAWRPAPALAAVAALAATSWRWGSSSLEAVAGAQAVLGPAGWVGPTLAAAGSWLGAVALVAATPGFAAPVPRAVAAVASGAAAAVVVAGPAPGGDLWVRVLGSAVAAGLALVIGRERTRSPRARVILDALAVVAGAAALVVVGREAGGWAGTLSSDAIGEGIAVGVAATAVVLVAHIGRAAMEQRRA
jgi:hypothetical protein